jgi:hypothetical protein
MNIPSFSGYVVLPQLSQLEISGRDRRRYDPHLRWTAHARDNAIQACRDTVSSPIRRDQRNDERSSIYKDFQLFQQGCLSEQEATRLASSAFFHLPQLPPYYGLLFTPDRTVMDIRIVIRGDDGRPRKLNLEGERHHSTSDADWINQLATELGPISERGTSRRNDLLQHEYFWGSPHLIEVDAQTQRSGRPIPALARYNDLVRLLKEYEPLLRRNGIYINCMLSPRHQWRARAETPIAITIQTYGQEARTLPSEYELRIFLNALRKRRIAQAGEHSKETG